MSFAGGPPPIRFTRAGAMLGARRTIVIGLGGVLFSMLFGMVARQAGLSFAETLLMDGIVFAGTSQLIVLGMWAGSALWPIVLTTLVINLRHLLMGASLQPWLERLPARQTYASAFFMTDETWALTMGALRDGERDGAFIVGSGLVLWVTGMIGVAIGYLAGAMVADPRRWGLDFVFIALFLVLLAGTWRGRADLLPWSVAGATAVAAAHWLPGNWYVVVGAIVGSVAGAVRDAR